MGSPGRPAGLGMGQLLLGSGVLGTGHSPCQIHGVLGTGHSPSSPLSACYGLGGSSKPLPEEPELVLLQHSFPASKRQ